MTNYEIRIAQAMATIWAALILIAAVSGVRIAMQEPDGVATVQTQIETQRAQFEAASRK